MTEIVKAEHTALPWALVEGPKSRGMVKSICKGFNQVVVAQAMGLETVREREANARLIVTAVNVYPAVNDLVKALESTVAKFDACTDAVARNTPLGINGLRSALARFRELQGGAQ